MSYVKAIWANRGQAGALGAMHSVDVAVDICRSVLSPENKRMRWVSEDSAIGFVVASDVASPCKTTDYWAPEFERSIASNDPAIGIQWHIRGEPSLSAKDQQTKAVAKAEQFA